MEPLECFACFKPPLPPQSTLHGGFKIVESQQNPSKFLLEGLLCLWGEDGQGEKITCMESWKLTSKGMKFSQHQDSGLQLVSAG